MTNKEWADRLDGREYGQELSHSEQKEMKSEGFVAVMGYSDDNVEFYGAINDEVGMYEGGKAYVSDRKVSAKPHGKSRVINCLWCFNDVPWTFRTRIPHEEFRIMESGEVYCVGIVFNVADI